MAAVLNNTEAVETIAGILGYLKIEPNTLEWANDVPAACGVMSAVAAQLDVVSSAADASIDPAYMLYSSFKDIALEDKELQVLKGISDNPPQPNPTLSGYILPSQLKREVDCIQQETQLFEEEAEQLRVRTQQVITASRTMSHDIRSLHNYHSNIQSNNEDSTGRIDDLSMQMDGTIADSIHTSYSLLSSFDPLTHPGYASSLEDINRAYSAYTGSFTCHLDAMENSREAFFAEARFDAEEFEEFFKRYAPDVKSEDMPSSVQEFYQQEAYLAQVDGLCDQMEAVNVSQHSSDSDIMRSALYLAGSCTANQRSGVIPNARAEVEAAVTRDQIAYLDARANFLDNAASVMVDVVMTPLDHLLSSLSLEDKLVKEAEVLCGVLHEEVLNGVESITTTSPMPFPPTPASSAIPESPKDLGVHVWERELESRLHLYGPGEDALFQTLSSLSAGNRTVLDAVYANSPLNTSPPFACSCNFIDLINEARSVTAKLSGETDRLTKEVENGIESRRTQRKLGAFVDQWATA